MAYPQHVPPQAPLAPLNGPPNALAYAPADDEHDTQEYLDSVYADGAWSHLSGPHVGALLVPMDQDVVSQELVEIIPKATLAAAGYTIGRNPVCDYTVDHTAVSNRHCCFRYLPHPGAPGQHYIAIQDLSTNGTLVNGQVVGKGNSVPISDGDIVSITAAARFIFQLPAQQRPRAVFSKHYRFERDLGAGAYASVFLARRRRDGKAFAVKRFDHHRIEPPAQNKGIVQELSVLSSVSHPNLLCMEETFNEPDGFHIVLEYAPGGDLFRKLSSNKAGFSERRARSICSQLCGAIKYLHDSGVIHRDIKLDNILLMDDQPTVKLADFGLAKIVGETVFTTTQCGTPDYVAPEVLGAGINQQYTKAVDLWSLGVVLFMCLSGYPPFYEQRERQYPMAEQIKRGEYFFIRACWEHVDDSGLALVMGLLCVDPNQRYTLETAMAHPWMTMARRPPGCSHPGYYYGERNPVVTRV